MKEYMKKSKEVLVLILSVMGCRKPYTPPASSTAGSYLVVEGVINAGADSTFIKLSQTVSLSDSVTANPVLHATLTVESDQNAIYPLTETSNGFYAAKGLNLDNTRKYRLRIQTNGDQYLSDFAPVVNAPAIDTITYHIQSNGVQLFASTHDPKNNTHYYRWSYNETWIFHSRYRSFFISNGDTVLSRDSTRQIYKCWSSDTSSTVILASSVKLSQDVISNIPITFVASTSEKFVDKYSILVKQYALTADAYNFWTNLKKNTEQLGSIFDAEPSQINGNIHDVTNPSKPVIGYISVGSVAAKRIFITTQQLPVWVPVTPYGGCTIGPELLQYHIPGTNLVVNQEDEYFNYLTKPWTGELLIPVEDVRAPLPNDILLGHTGSTPFCVDCTLRGTTKQPSFWK